ncbi:hypothetical protein MPNT_10352 [Candidatus Methylacidithermus pantelleriae]|uniref:Uncharacterized protein n=1 Tax=Candidatus Methylacidithermus pantelleriae TaxID=2744239 RepID=A0A8J2BMJ7_9BACT|nr:hypothetical protein MPNT_10352 [Candidatus Methylacidithermus pantelleriae]
MVEEGREFRETTPFIDKDSAPSLGYRKVEYQAHRSRLPEAKPTCTTWPNFSLSTGPISGGTGRGWLLGSF